MKHPALFPAHLIAAGWEPVEVTLFAFFFLSVSETRYKSPHNGKTYKLHKALKKEVQSQQRMMFI